jgi:FtsP/CotA-like multicopper oxidase with cupredoxin domain
LAVAALCWAAGYANAQNGNANGPVNGKVTGLAPCVVNGKSYQNCPPGMQKQARRQQAAKIRKQKRAAATAAGITVATYDPAKGPDYFGVEPNYANSPVPKGSIGSIVPIFGGTGYTAAPSVTITDAYGSGSGAAASATVVNGVITGFTVTAAGSGYLAPVVTVTDSTGAGASARAVLTGIVPGTGMRKFVDTLPIPPIATSTPCTYSGQAADCYEIWLVEYTQQMHSDLPATKLRGYAQIWPIGTTTYAPGNPSYLGPIIVAQRNKPVRVTFKNKLPTGAGGNLFIPVDTTYMGAGAGPSGGSYTQNRAAVHLHGGVTPWISDGTIHQWTTPAGESTSYPKGVSVYNVPDMPNPGKSAPQGELTFYYTNQQSARLMFYHDHALGITRLNVYAGEAAGYLLQDATEATLKGGGSIVNPYTNATVTVAANTIPDAVGIPLVIQDKSFVPSLTQLKAQDPSWENVWPTPATGDLNGNGALWFPHVYMPNQNPYDVTGANAMGRWDYGPWFWPPFTGLIHGAVPNPYCLPTPGVDCSLSPGEPPFKPGVPDTDSANTWSYGSKASGTPESFMDTPVVNGKAYPTLTVPAGPVRFRILSVGNDRMLNLSLWVAAAKDSGTTAGDPTPTVLCTDNSTVTPDRCTEVKMVPFNSAQNAITPFPSWWYTIVSNGFTFDDRAGGVPDPGTRGPAMIQIGTEGGWLPAPVLIRNQPVNYVYNRRDITVGNVNEKALFLGPAERADVIVDFSKFAGKTLILYNDSPAPVPAADPRLDYYTGDPDNTDTGGAPSTQPGYGPNTRTIMQIVVAGSSSGPTIAVDDYNPATLAALQTALPAAFAASEDKIIVPQAAYNAAYGTTTTDVPGANLSTIQATSLTFAPLGQTTPLTFEMEPKSIIEDFTVDYGRMNAILGVEIKHTNITNQTSIIQNLTDPPTELVKVSDPALTPIGAAADGTQIWKITHNGVDTHAIHFHMFNVQVVNRVGWDGAIRPPDPNELGFKDTVRMNPLEDIIVALRPIQLQNVPFKIPNSVHLLAPALPAGATTSATGAPLFNNVDPQGNPVTITNQPVNFGWEYVWHCHILGHEENDMMRQVAVAVPPEAPSNLVATVTGNGTNRRVVLTWVDNSLTANGFTIQRAGDPAFTTGLVIFKVGQVLTFTDPNAYSGQTFYYRVYANNTVGSTVPGYPTLTADSSFSNTAAVGVPQPPAAPSNLTATLLSATQVRLNWADNSNNETSFTIQRGVNGGSFNPLATVGANTTTYTDATVASSNTYAYRVAAVNGAGTSAFAGPVTITVSAPAAPSNFTAVAARGNGNNDNVTLTWTDNSNNETGFTIQRATNSAFTTGLNTATVGANVTTLTQTGLARNTNYYYRIQATNPVGSSAQVNAAPFPVLTP